MIVYPAIDIKDGRCVRLIEGDFDRATTFDEDPVAAARRWVAAGAEWLHVVDLDGARVGHPINLEAIRRICSAVDVPVQVGGGLRSETDIGGAFETGVERAILGTAALDSPDVLRAALNRWGERIAVGLDARDGRLATNAWLDQTEVDAREAAARFRAEGVQHLIFTDIRRDGTLRGPNLAALAGLVETLGTGVIASGGIGRPEDISAVARTGAAGVIVGRALYDGRVDLVEATALARRPAAEVMQ
jgi:phosphoribosylformimino-5-aminoimidazole carboxamide ribotide isomerase